MVTETMHKPIVARVRQNKDGMDVIVRRTLFKADGSVEKKYGLSIDGDWIEVPEREMYPSECYLPVAFFENKEE